MNSSIHIILILIVVAIICVFLIISVVVFGHFRTKRFLEVEEEDKERLTPAPKRTTSILVYDRGEALHTTTHKDGAQDAVSVDSEKPWEPTVAPGVSYAPKMGSGAKGTLVMTTPTADGPRVSGVIPSIRSSQPIPTEPRDRRNTQTMGSFNLGENPKIKGHEE